MKLSRFDCRYIVFTFSSVIFIVSLCSINHKDPESCSKASVAKGIPGKLPTEGEIQIKYTYSITYKVNGGFVYLDYKNLIIITFLPDL